MWVKYRVVNDTQSGVCSVHCALNSQTEQQNMFIAHYFNTHVRILILDVNVVTNTTDRKQGRICITQTSTLRVGIVVWYQAGETFLSSLKRLNLPWGPLRLYAVRPEGFIFVGEAAGQYSWPYTCV